MTTTAPSTIESYLGDKAESLLGFSTPKISRSQLNLPGPDFVDRVYALSDRNNRVLVNLQRMFGHGRLAGTGYMSILPVDQGIEHSGGASFAKNPEYFDAENIVKLAMEGGCNAVASTFGVLGAVSRKYAHKIPFIGEDQSQRVADLSQQVRPDDVRHGQASRGHGRGRGGRNHLLRIGRKRPPDCRDQPGFPRRTSWDWPRCYGAICATAPSRQDKDYHVSADLTGQANHLGVTIQADIIKQKLPENNGGYQAMNADGTSYGKSTSVCTPTCAAIIPSICAATRC